MALLTYLNCLFQQKMSQVFIFKRWYIQGEKTCFDLGAPFEKGNVCWWYNAACHFDQISPNLVVATAWILRSPSCFELNTNFNSFETKKCILLGGNLKGGTYQITHLVCFTWFISCLISMASSWMKFIAEKEIGGSLAQKIEFGGRGGGWRHFTSCLPFLPYRPCLPYHPCLPCRRLPRVHPPWFL